MPLTLVSFIACPTAGLSTWRPEDYYAYKIVRVIAGRRIAGSAWMSAPDGNLARVTNGNGHVVVNWFLDRAVTPIEMATQGDRRPVLLPFPGPNRIVGAPPSGSRALAQELSARTGLRMLDVLRWRQRMPSCRPPDPQTYIDNLITTGSPVRADCILVADFVSSPAPLQAAAARLRQMGSIVVLAVSVGRTVPSPPADPFTTSTETIDDLAAVGV